MLPMKPGQLDKGLSRQFQCHPYLAAKGWRPKWANGRQRTMCDECFARQHESRGEYGPRERVTHTRTMPDGHRLYLCSAHTTLWRDQDEKTNPRKRTGAKKR